MEVERTILSDPFEADARPQSIGETTLISSPLVFRSIGYKCTALSGFEEAGISFNGYRGVLENDGLGRVLRAVSEGSVEFFPGLYCSGWVKRGPIGVIASTMDDAFATGDSIVEDWCSGKSFLRGVETARASGWEGVVTEIGIAARKVVSWQDWQTIDMAEKERGRRAGKEREKFTNIAEMLALLS